MLESTQRISPLKLRRGEFGKVGCTGLLYVYISLPLPQHGSTTQLSTYKK